MNSFLTNKKKQSKNWTFTNRNK